MTRPLEWMKAVRDHPGRPTGTQRLVLGALALRMDWQTGCGFASGAQLAADADCDKRTVKRATSWAREAKLLVQTRRGHRLGDGRTIASEWRLALAADSQQDTADPLNPISRGQSTDLKGTAGASQGDSTTPPSRPRSSRPRSSANGNGASAPLPSHAHTETPPRCPACHEEFPVGELHPDDLRFAMRGQLLCLRCEGLSDAEITELIGQQ